MVSVRKMATCILVGALTFAAQNETAKATETPVAGINLILQDYYAGSEDYKLAMPALLAAVSASQNIPEEQDMKLAFANVNNYVNIRSEANEKGKILGKLYKDSAATILDEEDGWYRVKSGSVTGYIKGDYLITGKEAEEFSEKTGETIAAVTTTTLRVRENASIESATLTLIPIEGEYKVLEEAEEWVKIVIDETVTGYVSREYVELSKVYDEAISIEEEQAELARQQAYNSRTASGQGNGSSGGQSGGSSGSISSGNSNSGSSAGNTTSLRQKIVNYALKFEGNPYVWGGTSLTRGADCSGFIQSVFEDFGIYVPRTSRAQASSGKRISMSDIRPGDLIFYRKNGVINHVALYIGNGKVIGAKSSGEGIRITRYNYRTPYKAVRYVNN